MIVHAVVKQSHLENDLISPSVERSVSRRMTWWVEDITEGRSTDKICEEYITVLGSYSGVNTAIPKHKFSAIHAPVYNPYLSSPWPIKLALNVYLPQKP
jgi:hypothetical protein